MSKTGLMIIVCDKTTRTLQTVWIEAVFNLFPKMVVDVVATQVKPGEISVVTHLTFRKELVVFKEILIKANCVRCLWMACAHVEDKLYMFRHCEITLWTSDHLNLGLDNIMTRLQ